MQGICFHFSPQRGSGYIEIFSGECFVPAVVFKRSLSTGDSNDTQFSGGKTPMAIAIWNGGNQGKKRTESSYAVE